MNTKELFAAEIAKVVPELDKKTFKICLKPLKMLTWGTSPFLPSHWLKSCARLLK